MANFQGGERVRLGFNRNERFNNRVGTVMNEQDFTLSKVKVRLDAMIGLESIKVSVLKSTISIESGDITTSFSLSSSSSSSSSTRKRNYGVSFSTYQESLILTIHLLTFLIKNVNSFHFLVLEDFYS